MARLKSNEPHIRINDNEVEMLYSDFQYFHYQLRTKKFPIRINRVNDVCNVDIKTWNALIDEFKKLVDIAEYNSEFVILTKKSIIESSSDEILEQETLQKHIDY